MIYGLWYKSFLSCPIVLNFCEANDSNVAVFWATFYDWITKLHVMDERDFVRFEHKISFALISHIVRTPAQSSSKLSWLEWRETVPAIRTRDPSQYKDRLSRYGISIIMIRRSWDRLIFIMGNPILVRRCLHIETALRLQDPFWSNLQGRT